MGLLDPAPLPYDPLDWVERPFSERARMVCEAWARQGYGSPLAVTGVYGLKILAYVAGWAFACSLTPGLGGLSDIASWWLEPLAFQKAILWSLLFEVLGLGCGSGPLTGRYLPPVGGFLYFLRPGTARLPPWQLSLGPLSTAGDRRTWVDVLLYAGLLGALGLSLVAAELSAPILLPIALLLGLLGLRDKTVFLAARSEHYLVTVLVFLLATDRTQMIAGAMGVQAALWLGAGVSKLNHHFASVVCVMLSNSPVMRSVAVRERLYRDFPSDLRPSRLAAALGHLGTALELGVPLVLLTAGDGPMLVVGLLMMLALHGFITSNVPMGVPLEWNVMVVYGAFALFWAHPEVSVLDMGWANALLVLGVSVGLPVLGNLRPDKVSFLPAMRYYAGNWAMSTWLFRGESYRKLHQGLTMSAPWVEDQLALLYERGPIVGLIGKVMGFRLMHLHGRSLGLLVPKVLDGPLRDHTWVDGELVAGLVLGWNFGEGHLHDEQLLGLIQRACAFEPGELRCVFVESQPALGRSLRYRLHDGATGLIEEGELPISELLARQPWETAPL
ncbi:MAG: DUF3556 domain-containing protein [Alphaproteobacteria bacterium]|nr:DUF3556 domain-containing protein [Alphaproteobacteria bacterium]